ncbi:DDE-type integrase/transposase/recombinase [Corynebacterium cystitidis]|uniref:Integrase core domain-containing protein n=1 Tax=Corynebacterium cystitidis DSM 20524 TaxID=1121357 RepID=A0A1H9WQR1_9CORY|nr:DDE-type integrase/transposase/recombinase [Corynebacterium cystitidis]WJY83608.1 Integrase core domain protein [Corynebacterium cystitidis DSM 20524]SES36154.1 Integrase core domain-containing protein [Corynebacterium cystitidis DSM 20524]SNV91766.1 transposase-like protein [Corynebacterium cystitidis]
MRQVLQEHEYSISPATYYRYQQRGFGPTQAELEDAYAAHRLYKLWVDNKRVYGKLKLWEEAKRQGWIIGRDQVRRLMNILGITGVSRRKTIRTTISNPAAERIADRIKRAWKEATHPDQWWVADFTYMPTACSFSYVAFVEDVYTRELLAFVVDDRPDRWLVIRALKQAVAHRRRQDPTFDTAGVIHH